MAVILDADSPKVIDLSGKETTDGNEYTAVWQVKSDNVLDGPKTILNAAGLPAIGQTWAYGFETDTSSFLVERTPNLVQERQPYAWNVTLQYRPAPVAENPPDRDPEVRWSFVKFEEAVEKDLDGTALLNSAGQYFDPPIVVERSNLLLSYSRYEPTYDVSRAKEYQDAVNSDQFLSFGPREAKVQNIGAVREKISGVFWYHVQYDIEFTEDSWRRKILDQGRYERLKCGNNAGNLQACGPEDVIAILDCGGDPVQDPVPLDGEGCRIKNVTPDTAVFLPSAGPGFKFYKEKSFASLNIVL